MAVDKCEQVNIVEESKRSGKMMMLNAGKDDNYLNICSDKAI